MATADEALAAYAGNREWSLTVRTGAECCWEAVALVAAAPGESPAGHAYAFRAVGCATASDAAHDAVAGLIGWAP